MKKVTAIVSQCRLYYATLPLLAIFKKITAIVSQCRLYYATLPLLAIISGFLIAENYNINQLLLFSISFLFTHCFESSINNTYDVSGDRLSLIMRSQNPIVTGDLTLREAKVINAVSLFLSVFVSLYTSFYWIILTAIMVTLVILYDLKPFRLKDTPFEIIIVPLYTALPFLFSYLSFTSSFSVSPMILLIFLFLFLNLVTDLRHIPDFEHDAQRGAETFTVTFGVDATRKVELLSTILALCSLIAAVLLGVLSILGFPLILLTTAFKVSLLVKGNDVLKNPDVWKKFSQAMITNNGALLLSIIGTTLSIGLIP